MVETLFSASFAKSRCGLQKKSSKNMENFWSKKTFWNFLKKYFRKFWKSLSNFVWKNFRLLFANDAENKVSTTFKKFCYCFGANFFFSRKWKETIDIGDDLLKSSDMYYLIRRFYCLFQRENDCLSRNHPKSTESESFLQDIHHELFQ